MKSIDLSKFALHSQKLPESYLAYPEQPSVTTFKLVGALFFDFWICVSATSMMAQIHNLAVKSFLNSRNLQLALAQGNASKILFWILPVTMLCYFFMSYFMNHGQTWGMHLFKVRLEIKSKDFKQAWQWALNSFAICYSGGLYYYFSQDKWDHFKTHDYLYHSLMEHKEIYSIDLLQRINEFEKEEVLPEYEAA